MTSLIRSKTFFHFLVTSSVLSRQFIRENPDEVRRALDAKGVDNVDLEQLLELDEEWRKLKRKGDKLRHERNEISDRVGDLIQEGNEGAAVEAIEQSQELKEKLAKVESEAVEVEEELERELLKVPNVPDEEATVGEDETDNPEIRRWGFDDLHDLPDDVVPHYDLAEDLDIIDFQRGAKVAGGGFQFLKGDGARLEYALINFMTDLHREEHGYVDVFPPIQVDSESMVGTGQFPKFVDDVYRVGGSNDEQYEDDDHWLLPTAEVPVTNMYRGEIMLDKDLPIKHVAYSPNFRREAGEHGTETRGYVRIHQFNKVELVNFVRPENSEKRHQELIDEASEVCDRNLYRRYGFPSLPPVRSGGVGTSRRYERRSGPWRPLAGGFVGFEFHRLPGAAGGAPVQT